MAAPRWHSAQTIFTVSMSTGELHRDGFDKTAQHAFISVGPSVQTACCANTR